MPKGPFIPCDSSLYEGVRVCNACGAEKSIDDFYIKKQSRSGKLYRTLKCKECILAINKAYNAKHKERLREIRHKRYWDDPERFRKEASEYGRKRRERDPDGVRAQKRSWDNANRDKKREMDRRSRKKHGAEWNRRSRERYQVDLEYRSKKIAADAAWVKANPEKACFYKEEWARKNPEKAKLSRERTMARWKKEDPGGYRTYVREKTRRRRSRIKAHETDITASFLRKLKKKYGGVCYYCGANFDEAGRELDHVVPISKGGRHMQDNVVYACVECNRRKHDKLVEQFIVDYFGVAA